MTATVQLSLAEAAVYANRYIVQRAARLCKLREEMLRRATRRTWWQRLFGLPARTLEQAHQRLSDGHPFNEYNLLQLSGGRYAGAARDIATAATHAMDHRATVTVDADILAQWMKAPPISPTTHEDTE